MSAAVRHMIYMHKGFFMSATVKLLIANTIKFWDEEIATFEHRLITGSHDRGLTLKWLARARKGRAYHTSIFSRMT
jgi:hypothetical protein